MDKLRVLSGEFLYFRTQGHFDVEFLRNISLYFRKNLNLGHKIELSVTLIEENRKYFRPKLK